MAPRNISRHHMFSLLVVLDFIKHRAHGSVVYTRHGSFNLSPSVQCIGGNIYVDDVLAHCNLGQIFMLGRLSEQHPLWESVAWHLLVSYSSQRCR